MEAIRSSQMLVDLYQSSFMYPLSTTVTAIAIFVWDGNLELIHPMKLAARTDSERNMAG